MSVSDKDQQGMGPVHENGTPVSLAEHFTRSQKFRDLFAYGMDLVEQTANFLDTEGREASRELNAKGQALYGTESMRLTTRLMQLASWLLLQRAVADGELTYDQAVSEKKNVKLNQLPSRMDEGGWELLPARFNELVRESLALQRRIIRLDAEIYAPASENAPARNPIAAQHSLLETAFDKRFSARNR